jgi:amino acid transporter
MQLSPTAYCILPTAYLSPGPSDLQTIRMSDSQPGPALIRRFGLLQATALNMSNMIGVGPFITIPLLMTALGGPQALVGWLVALVIVIADGLVWSELGAAMPGSGGSYTYLREGFGRERWGRLVAFLFIWQFILSGPLEIASGYIGFARYLRYVWPGLQQGSTIFVAVVVGLVNIALLYRRIESVGRLTVSLWVGTLLTTAAVIATGAMHFNPAVAFGGSIVESGVSRVLHLPFSVGFLFGLGAASRIGIYDYLGYFSVAYIGDEVRDPGRVIPRSILISVVAVGAIYLGINLSVIGVVPWREFVPAAAHPQSDFVVSVFMERVYGARVATFFTALVLWTAFGSVFALLLGYSRIPYAAALDGTFFRVFGRVHATKRFPHVSLLVTGVIAIAASTLSLGMVIDALITTRILVQFIGQVVALTLLRRNAPDMARPFKVWLYPLPNLVALFGWIFLFATSGWDVIAFGLGTLLLGVAVFFIWARHTRRWPFASHPTTGAR